MTSLPRFGPTVRSSMIGERRRQGAWSAAAPRARSASCEGEVAADLALAAEDRLADHGRGQHLAVEDDGEGTADIGLGDLAELARTGRCRSVKETIGSLVRWSKPALASVKAVAGNGDAVLDRHICCRRWHPAGSSRRAAPPCWDRPTNPSIWKLICAVEPRSWRNRVGSCRPGSWTRMRSLPTRWISGSATPTWSTRRRMISRLWSTAAVIRSLRPASVSLTVIVVPDVWTSMSDVPRTEAKRPRGGGELAYFGQDLVEGRLVGKRDHHARCRSGRAAGGTLAGGAQDAANIVQQRRPCAPSSAPPNPLPERGASRPSGRGRGNGLCRQVSAETLKLRWRRDS